MCVCGFHYLNLKWVVQHNLRFNYASLKAWVCINFTVKLYILISGRFDRRTSLHYPWTWRKSCRNKMFDIDFSQTKKKSKRTLLFIAKEVYNNRNEIKSRLKLNFVSDTKCFYENSTFIFMRMSIKSVSKGMEVNLELSRIILLSIVAWCNFYLFSIRFTLILLECSRSGN